VYCLRIEGAKHFAVSILIFPFLNGVHNACGNGDCGMRRTADGPGEHIRLQTIDVRAAKRALTWRNCARHDADEARGGDPLEHVQTGRPAQYLGYQCV